MTDSLPERIKHKAGDLGFPLVGFLPVSPSLTHGFYMDWLARGYAGKMDYLHRHAPQKMNPGSLEPAARSLIVLGHPYSPSSNRVEMRAGPAGGSAQSTEEAFRGRISNYALGRDYHDVIRKKIEQLASWIEQNSGRPLTHRVCVDTAPVMEREFAARAGLGWVGKNAMLIHWKLGSWLFLAELLVDLELPPDLPPPPSRRQLQHREHENVTNPPEPALRDSCGSCTACIQACPTGAIVAGKTVDARRCISYLTIELKAAIPRELRSGLGDWVFGCDVCQEVCPWNRKAPSATEPAFQGAPDVARPSLIQILSLDEERFRQRFRHTPLWRPRRRGVLRNAAIALGNQLAVTPPSQRQGALRRLQGVLNDPEPLVRGAAAWALGRTGDQATAGTSLAGRLVHESDPEVQEEILAAIDTLARPEEDDDSPMPRNRERSGGS